MEPLTLFSWGFWGWGTATEELIKLVDEVEKSRGFNPPKFVDIRIRRSGRAPGFVGKAFENLVGEDRYKWIDDLGNEAIVTHSGSLKIKNPASANDLLNLAVEELQNRNRRLLFFCACKLPKVEGELYCHRDEVAELVLKSAGKQNLKMEIIEWPGGEPKRIEIEVAPKVFKALKHRSSIPLGQSIDLVKYGGLPWGSTLALKSSEGNKHFISGPSLFERKQWTLPIYGEFDTDTDAKEIKKKAAEFRQSWGLERRGSE